MGTSGAGQEDTTRGRAKYMTICMVLNVEWRKAGVYISQTMIKTITIMNSANSARYHFTR